MVRGGRIVVKATFMLQGHERIVRQEYVKVPRVMNEIINTYMLDDRARNSATHNSNFGTFGTNYFRTLNFLLRS